MLADIMLPEAVEQAGSVVGLATVLWFAAAFLLSMPGPDRDAPTHANNSPIGHEGLNHDKE